MVSGKNEDVFFPRKLKMGMVGGGRDSFIGAVHRRAAQLDGAVELVAGAFSSTPEKSKASARDLYVPENRAYGSYQEMIEEELKLPEGERIDFVSVTTPNHMHFPVSKAFLDAGISVACEKPMVHSFEQAKELAAAIAKTGAIFAVTYNYSGYPMAKQARHMIMNGDLGEIHKIIVEYPQGWLLDAAADATSKQANWRTDPARSGIAGCIGDIGSHCEQLMSYMTGLELDAICADMTTFGAGRRLDDDGNILLRFQNGARGILAASQISPGEENNLMIRIWGSKAGLEWHQENPNYLYVRDNEGPERIYKRGNPYMCPEAVAVTRLPTGHPEAFYEAFANVYKNFTDTIRARILGIEPSEMMLDFPNIIDGARGVYFIEKAVESNASELKWTPAAFPGI
jgi:predicted dehydrogenase